MSIQIRILKPTEKIPLDLLLLADPSVDQINQYLPNSTTLLAETNTEIVGVCVLLKKDSHEMEIMNLAVSEKHQRQGIGSYLLQQALDFASSQKISRLLIGTADSSTHQLNLYQRTGFTEYERISNFFIDHYENPIYENGVQARDMIRLELII